MRTRAASAGVRRRWRAQAGQASLEILAYLPALILLGYVCFQLLAVGYAAVLADHAAEAAALAIANGGDPAAAAQDAVPGWSRERLTTRRDGGEVTVCMRPLSPLRVVSRRLAVAATATVEQAAGS